MEKAQGNGKSMMTGKERFSRTGSMHTVYVRNYTINRPEKKVVVLYNNE